MRTLKRSKYIALMAIIYLLSLNGSARAEYAIESSLIGTGGGISTGQRNLISGTMGQSFCNTGMGTDTRCFSGFWNVASYYYNPVFVEGIDKPGRFSLIGNYPNPFNPATTISFELPETMNASLKVYSVSGQLVSTLINEELPAGQHTATWTPGQEGAGVYLYKLETKERVMVKKMMYLK